MDEERSVLVRLRADVGDFIQGYSVKATKATRDLSHNIIAESAKSKKAMTDVGLAYGVVGAAGLLAVGKMVSSAADFEQAISRVRAATHASETDIQALSKAALDAGRTTVFSATDAADAVTELAKAGVSVKDILAGGLSGSLSLASAGELDVADAANIAATALNQFGLAGADVPHVADLLAAAAGKAQGEVTDMAQALKYVGPIAAGMGISIEETAGSIAELASKGILADQAGTGLRGMLASLTAPSQQASKAMQALGIDVYDAQGNFVGFRGVAQQLQGALGGLTESQRDAALGVIFGNQQLTVARILYDGGARSVDSWTQKVNDSGYAAETAALKLDNLNGDVENLRGSLETAFIKTGSSGEQMARGVVQDATQIVNAYNKLPGPVQDATFKLGLFGAAGVTAAAGLLIALPRIADTRKALVDLRNEAPRTTRALGLMGKAFTALAIINVADSLFSLSSQKLQMISGAIEAAAGPDAQAQIDALTVRMQKLREEADKAPHTNLGFTTVYWTDFTGPGSEKGPTAAAEKAAFLEKRIKELQAAQDQASQAASHATQVSYDQATALGFVGDSADEVGAGLDDVKAAVQGLDDAFADDSAAIDFQGRLGDLKSTFDDMKKKDVASGKALDITTKAGRDAKSVLIDLIKAAAEHGEKVFEATGDVDKFNTVMERHKKQISDVAKELGINKGKVDDLLADYEKIPETIRTNIKLAGISEARHDLQQLLATLREADGKVYRYGGTYSAGAAINDFLAGSVRAKPAKSQKKAGGGRFAPGLLTVGEQGTETMWMDGSGYVANHADTARMISAMRMPDPVVVRVPVQEQRTHEDHWGDIIVQGPTWGEIEQQLSTRRDMATSPSRMGARR